MTMADGTTVGLLGERSQSPDDHGAACFSRQGADPLPERLAGMEITPAEEDPSQTPVTLLEGSIQDQAQLSGLLNTLYDMGFPLVKVVALEE